MISLVAMAMLLLWNDASGKLFNITEGWSSLNNDSSSTIGTSYNLVSAFLIDASDHRKQSFVQSDNGLFGLAFYNLKGGGYYLSVMMGVTNSSAAVPVWTANRGKPMSKNLILKKMNGRLLLQDFNSTSVTWPEGFSKLEMKDTGNLVLYNDTAVIWQSFDHPTNVLLPTQRLVTGQSLTSNANSSTMSEGMFMVSMEGSGVVLSVKSSSSQERQPYFLWSLSGRILETAEAVCPDYIAYLQYTAVGAVDMSFIKNVTTTTRQPCGPSLNVGLSSDTAPRYIQLMENGELVAYRLHETGSWEADFKLTQFLGPSQSECSLPLTCGSYGICAGNGVCSCFRDHETSNITFQSVTCQKPSWSSLTNCSSRYVTDFVRVSGASYFTNRYVNPDIVSSTAEDCLEACKSNCSCSALFYDKSARNCFFAKDILGSLTTDQSYDAYLKFQDHSKLAEVRESVSSSKKIITITCSLGVALLVITGSLLLLWGLRRRQNAEIANLLIALQGPPKRFTYIRLLAATRNFTKPLGSGGFGSVYEGVFSNGKRLAVKRLHSTTRWQKQFITEMVTMGTVSHMNIVKLCGFCAEPSRQLLVYEFMPNGSLDKWIFTPQETPLSWSRRYSIALGTARGLAYLHEESREPIIHLDIKPQNILLDENFVAKVGDFGMAKLLMSRDISQVVTGVRGTPGYLAPEWLLHSLATKKCDVYSYGMVLLELIGGRKNLDAARVETPISWFFPAWAVDQIREGNILNVIDSTIRQEADVEQAMMLIKVAFWCIQDNPGDRPAMDVVVKMLEGQEEVNQPPLNFHFTVQASGVISIKATHDNIAVAYAESTNTMNSHQIETSLRVGEFLERS